MAAVTINKQLRTIVMGHVRVEIADIDIAADTDTWATGLNDILYAAGTSPTNNAIGLTKSGGTITWQTAGAEAGVLAIAIGF